MLVLRSTAESHPMRRLVGSVFQSLDGVIQGPGGPTEDLRGGFAHGGWVSPLWDDRLRQALGAVFAAPYDLLLGKRTYEIFAAYWPFVPPENPIGAAFNGATKHVLTHAGADLDWQNSHRLPDIAAVRALKAGQGPDLLIQGSASLYPQLLAAGLIDRITIMTFPVLLGAGRRLFGAGTPPISLRQVAADVSPKGVVVAVYEPAGAVETAAIADYPPSGAEVQRRARWAEDVGDYPE